MRIYINERRVRRLAMLGRFLVGLGLGVLAIGFVVSLRSQEQVSLVLLAALGGTITSQIGIVYLNRWSRRPRMDDVLDQSLKGLDDRWVLFHYASGTNHVLSGPQGTLSLVPRPEAGEIRYQEGSWWQDKPRRGILRRGGRNKLKGLEDEARAQAQAAARWLAARADGEETPEVGSLVVFVHEEAGLRLESDSLPVPAVHRKKLKEWLRRQPKGDSLSRQEVAGVVDALGLSEKKE